MESLLESDMAVESDDCEHKKILAQRMREEEGERLGLGSLGYRLLYT